MRKSKQERIRELMTLLDSDDDSKFQDMTEEEIMGELYLAKKIAKKKEEDEEGVIYCSLM